MGEDGKNPDCQIHVPPEAIHGLLMCSERIAQEENFNGGHMTLEEGVFFANGEVVFFKELDEMDRQGDFGARNF